VKKSKDRAKIEVRRNGTFNTPFLLSSKANINTSKGGGFSYFASIKLGEKTLRFNKFQILDKPIGEEHHYTKQITRKQVCKL
jgi:hypothetical protein